MFSVTVTVAESAAAAAWFLRGSGMYKYRSEALVARLQKFSTRLGRLLIVYPSFR